MDDINKRIAARHARMNGLLARLWKNLWCRFFHERCYPEVHIEHSTYWHCCKCHPCGEEMTILLEELEAEKRRESSPRGTHDRRTAEPNP